MTSADKAFIRDNCLILTAAEIAEVLDRTEEGIALYIKRNKLSGGVHKPATEARTPTAEALTTTELTPLQIQTELRATEAWKMLQQEFTRDELVFFDEKYVDMMMQLGDATATERTQVTQAIKFELLMSRNLVARNRALEEISQLEEMMRQHIKDHGGIFSLTEKARSELLGMENQLNLLRSSEQSKTAEYTKLQERCDKLMESLKATRDKRLDRIQSDKTDFLSVLRELQERDVQDREGRQMELMKLAGQRAKENLGRPIKYDDGNMDNPILCCDTVDLEPEES